MVLMCIDGYFIAEQYYSTIPSSEDPEETVEYKGAGLKYKQQILRYKLPEIW